MKTLALALSVLLIAAVAIAWYEHGRVAAAVATAGNATEAALASDFEASAARADVQRVTVYVDRVQVVQATTTAIQRDIPAHVTPETDRAFPLSVGFVRVHDAAALGVPIPEGTGDLDARASPVAPSVAAAGIVGNYGTCRATAEQLIALQGWVVAHGLADADP